MREIFLASARELMAMAPAIDLHAHPLLWPQITGFDLTRRHTPSWLKAKIKLGGRHLDLPRLREGLVGVVTHALVGLPGLTSSYRPSADGQLAVLQRLLAQVPNQLQFVQTTADIRALSAPTVGLLLGAEGAEILQGNPQHVEVLALQGVRYLTLLHFRANGFGHPSVGYGRDDDAGLTALGFQTCFACWDNGVLVDLAHLNRKGFMQVCELTRQPVISSHTGVKGVHDHPRNLDDEQIRAVAKHGGVIGVMFGKLGLGEASLAQVIRHLEHLRQIGGDDVLAIGSDFDSTVTVPPELADVSHLPNLIAALLERRWRIDTLAKLLRGNVLRVLHDVPPLPLQTR